MNIDIAFMFNLTAIKPTLFLLCLFKITSAVSQNEIISDVVNISKISFLSPGFSYEQRIGRFQTLYGRAFLNPAGYIGYSSTFGTSSRLYLDPAITIQYRYYYNAKQRQERGRNTQMNNLNYLAPVFKMTFNAENSERTVYKTGLVWGLQRNYRKRFSLDLNLGLGYEFAKGSRVNYGDINSGRISEFTTIGQLNLGFWLNSRT
ncbi:MAG: hypothetical protein EOO04_38475 [Chitinophagaceae bacterium]|nr:MAG: hypothetical protein EOO04_38475 [Chitinophagaceae bacterium]